MVTVDGVASNIVCSTDGYCPGDGERYPCPGDGVNSGHARSEDDCIFGLDEATPGYYFADGRFRTCPEDHFCTSGILAPAPCAEGLSASAGS